MNIIVDFFHRVGYNVKKLFTEEHLYKDRDSQIKAIEITFDRTKTEVRSLTF